MYPSTNLIRCVRLLAVACLLLISALVVGGPLVPKGQAAAVGHTVGGAGAVPSFCFIVPAGATGSCGLPAASVTVTVSPSTIPANGTSTATVKATVVDSENDPVAGDHVSFSASPSADVSIGGVTDHGDGTYTATITSTTTAAPVTITATDSSVSPSVTNQATLTLSSSTTVGPATSVAVALTPSTITANGSSTSTATATVTDTNGNFVSGESVAFSASPSADVRIGGVTDHGDGTYTATITSTTTAAPVSITATDSSVSPSISGQATLTLSTGPGPAATVDVALTPSTVAADGASTSVATATVSDAGGNLVTGDSVAFSASPATDVSIGAVTNHHDGTYTVTITSATTAAPVTITATDSSVSPSISGRATLTLTGLSSAAALMVAVTPVAISADGSSHAFATATVLAESGAPVAGDSIQFFVDGQPSGAPCLTASNGECHVTLTSSTVVGYVTLTATDESAGLLSSNSVELYFVQIPSSQPPVTTTPTSTVSTTTTPALKSGPSVSKIRTSLAGALVPHGAGASIRSILKRSGYRLSYHAPGAGRLTIVWHTRSRKRARSLGSVTVTIAKAEVATVVLRLSSAGRALLARATRLHVTATATFRATDGTTAGRTGQFTLTR